MTSRIGWLLLGLTLLGGGCGRSGLLAPSCLLSTSASMLDFGEVRPGDTVQRQIALYNSGSGSCVLSDIAASAASDGFTLDPGEPGTLTLDPDHGATVAVNFTPPANVLPLARSGALRFVYSGGQDDSEKADVPLTARIHSECTLTVAPASIDFGLVALGATETEQVLVTDSGLGPCELANFAIAAGSDDEFVLTPGQAASLTIQPGDSVAIRVDFDASAVAPPHHRTGTLTFDGSDPAAGSYSVPLSADLDVGCDLTITPPSLDFGNVILNTTETAPVTLGNDGTRSCIVSGIRLGAGTDPAFTLAAGQLTSFTVNVGDSVPIPITFSASDSQPPHQKTGTLLFATGNMRAPDAIVPLSAYVNTVCVEASRWIYTVDVNGLFSRFDPATLSFTDIARLACPSASTPNSMAVDQNAVAWVAYLDGELFQVDTGTGACTPTNFVVGQDGLIQFGMGFVFNPNTGTDTLYIAGGADSNIAQSTLATISFPSLTVTPVGTVPSLPELSGLGDGTLWGFIPGFESSTGSAQLLQFSPANGATLQSFSYPTLTGSSNWAMKFWGGSFWIFVGQSIYQVDRNAPATFSTAVANSGRSIVGAGVSTCAPLQ